FFRCHAFTLMNPGGTRRPKQISRGGTLFSKRQRITGTQRRLRNTDRRFAGTSDLQIRRRGLRGVPLRLGASHHLTRLRQGENVKSNYRSLHRVIHSRLALAASLVLASASVPLAAQDGPGPGPIGPGPGCNLFPAPPSIGAGVNLSYFGPPPS